MLFSSVTFIFYFLPIMFCIYYLSKNKYKNYVLLFFSFVFYAWGGLSYVPLLLISIIMNYFIGIYIDRYKENLEWKKRVLYLGIFLNVIFLGIFKYTNFFVDNINIIFNQKIEIPLIALPLGISFYTFQAISYIVDVYRGDGKVQKKFLNLAIYISMFPQLLSGPIVRYKTIEKQIDDRSMNFEKFNYGVERFIVGFFKKVIISNGVGELVIAISSLGNEEMAISTAWLGAIAYSLQIFFDFAGYSDMAIGLGRMLGFEILENFNFPYISRSVGEFWRRWHISLGTWFREYIYIPLGGNRVKPIIAYRNLAIVWAVTGLWHGASWNFIIWGMYFGGFLMLEKVFLNNVLKKLPKWISHIYLLVVVIFGWVIFSNPDMGQAINYMGIMVGVGNYPLINGYTGFFVNQYLIILVLGVVLSIPIIQWIKNIKSIEKIINVIKPMILIGIFILTIVYMINSTFNSFIYFNF